MCTTQLINETELIFSKDTIDFKKRFIKSLIVPWFFVWIGLLVFISFQISFLWIITVFFIVSFISMNYKAMEQLLTKAEVKDDYIKFTYYNSNMEKKTTEILINEMSVEYYGNGKGISSLVSNHLKIRMKEKTIIKQYKTDNWTYKSLKETVKKLNEIKNDRKTNANNI